MKVAIVYSTTTGNTGLMAEAIREGAIAAGHTVLFLTADSADAEQVLSNDVIVLGSPAMGDEVLEDSMEEFFSRIEGGISGKKVAVFGSYDWGDGQWLRDWVSRISGCGGNVINGEGLKCQLTPQEPDIEECKKLGGSL